MFGLLDELCIKKDENRYDNTDDKYLVKIEKSKNSNSKDEVWICFLPWHTNIKKAKKFNLLPRNKNLIIVQEPNILAAYDPKIAKKLLLELDIKIDHLINSNFKHYKINVLTISIGTYPGTYFANKHRAKKVILLVPGDKLGKCIYTGDVTVDVKVNAVNHGFNTANWYDEILKGTNPIENIKFLPNNNVEVHLAMSDRYIKTKEGLRLVEKLKKENKISKLHKYYFFGHIETILLFGIKNKLGLQIW